MWCVTNAVFGSVALKESPFPPAQKNLYSKNCYINPGIISDSTYVISSSEVCSTTYICENQIYSLQQLNSWLSIFKTNFVCISFSFTMFSLSFYGIIKLMNPSLNVTMIMLNVTVTYVGTDKCLFTTRSICRKRKYCCDKERIEGNYHWNQHY